MKSSQAYTWTFGTAAASPPISVLSVQRPGIMSEAQVCMLLNLRDRFYNRPHVLIQSLRHHMMDIAQHLVTQDRSAHVILVASADVLD